jgi:hypothetical protein
VAGASVEGTVLGVESLSVGGRFVSVTGNKVGVLETGEDVGVFTPLQAATASANKSINRFIYLICYR